MEIVNMNLNFYFFTFKKFKNFQKQQSYGDFNFFMAERKRKIKKRSDKIYKYDKKDIFNANETGLFYRGTVTHGFLDQKEKPKGHKVSKERLTALVITNMDGSEKPKLVIIVKSANPRGFPRDLSTLSVQWEHSKKAWMIGKIWISLLQNWDYKLRLEGRKILLLIYNAPCHPDVPSLTNIQVELLPKNTTSIIQQLDSGIIKNLKGFYQYKFKTCIYSLFWRKMEKTMI